MKNKKKLFIISGSVIAVVLAVVLIVALSPKQPDTPEPPSTEESTKTTDIVIEDPSESTEPAEETTDENEDTSKIEETSVIEPDGKGLTPVEEKKPEQGTQGKNTEKETTEVVKPVEQTDPPKQDEPSSGGIVIGGNTPEPYDCGTPGHHCDGPETHAYVLNLELSGCPYCGKHDCPSFYATDEWGQTCYTPSKCPSYDIQKDPVHYCQKCGKPCGDGSNGTCAEYNIDIDCPICGEHVEAWTCHSCK